MGAVAALSLEPRSRAPSVEITRELVGNTLSGPAPDPQTQNPHCNKSLADLCARYRRGVSVSGQLHGGG